MTASVTLLNSMLLTSFLHSCKLQLPICGKPFEINSLVKIHVVTRAGGCCFRDSSANPISAVGDDRREFVDQKMVVLMCVSGIIYYFHEQSNFDEEFIQI